MSNLLLILLSLETETGMVLLLLVYILAQNHTYIYLLTFINLECLSQKWSREEIYFALIALPLVMYGRKVRHQDVG